MFSRYIEKCIWVTRDYPSPPNISLLFCQGPSADKAQREGEVCPGCDGLSDLKSSHTQGIVQSSHLLQGPSGRAG